MKIGYAFVRSVIAEVRDAEARLRSVGCRVLYFDRITSSDLRKELNKAIENIVPGDEIFVESVSQLGISFNKIYDALEVINIKGGLIRVIAKNEAKLENNLINIIQTASLIENKIEALKAKIGVAKIVESKRGKGRPVAADYNDAQEWITPDTNWKVISDWYGISRSSAFSLKKRVVGRAVNQSIKG